VTPDALTWPRLLATLLAREDLTADQARWAMREVMDDAHDPAELAAFLVALRFKGETAAEIGGLLDALMERAVRLPVDGSQVTDIVGTGGDGAHTINISTTAAIAAAAAGITIVKHGGKAVSSKSGSADVLEALGIPLDLTPGQVARCVTEIGIGFTFAPVFHGGLRHAAPVRRRLGVPTVINFLAPLTNPARPGTALVGCSSLALAPVLAAVLAERGRAGLIVRGHDGLDEITTTTATDIWTASESGVRHLTIDTARFGLCRAQPGDLRGGDAAYNAKAVRTVLGGDPGPALDAVLANAAGAFAARAAGIADVEETFADGLGQARTAIGSGAAAALLDRWIGLTHELATH